MPVHRGLPGATGARPAGATNVAVRTVASATRRRPSTRGAVPPGERASAARRTPVFQRTEQICMNRPTMECGARPAGARYTDRLVSPRSRTRPGTPPGGRTAPSSWAVFQAVRRDRRRRRPNRKQYRSPLARAFSRWRVGCRLSTAAPKVCGCLCPAAVPMDATLEPEDAAPREGCAPSARLRPVRRRARARRARSSSAPRRGLSLGRV